MAAIAHRDSVGGGDIFIASDAFVQKAERFRGGAAEIDLCWRLVAWEGAHARLIRTSACTSFGVGTIAGRSFRKTPITSIFSRCWNSARRGVASTSTGTG